MKDVFEKYLLALRKTLLNEKTEHTDRSALEALLQSIADEVNPGTHVQHEPKRERDKGAPDFKVTKGGLILGYVENKGIGENLLKVLNSEQLKKYRTLSDNILLTDYINWIWISGPGKPQGENLCLVTDLENPKFKLRDDRVVAVTKLLQGFFSTAPVGIGRAQQLALALAVRSRLLRDYLGEELVRQEREHKEGRLYGLYQIFRDQVFNELTIKEFADALAQMLAYGLFLARLNSDSELVTLHNAREYIPGSFRLIRELVDFLTELEKKEYRDVRWVVEEVLSIVNSLHLEAIHEDLSFRGRRAINRNVRARDEEEHRLFERDPFIYFYEDYLRAYDQETRESRGVYYTPPPVVNFIVRAIDGILKDKDVFGIKVGLADHNRVTVLDFACGTGTFLLEVFQRAFDNIGGPDSGKADPLVRDHFLKNIFGFEYLIAPYTIAHLKLSQYLKDEGHPLKEGERLLVFLTNTLEPIEPQKHMLLPELTHEVEEAQKVKDQPILVITGNPPYSGISRNMGDAAKALIERYKYVDGEHFGERKHWLHDDYVKFIAFAQSKMDAVEEGVVGVITNHAWIYNPTFKGMRQSLMKTFQQIYIIDLHGSSKPKEIPPEGFANENVFDIMKGVSITLFVKRKDLEPGVWFGEIWGRRLEKYRVCAISQFKEIASERIKPERPHYFFSPHTAATASDWGNHIPLDQIFALKSAGMLTARDRLNIGLAQEELLSRLRTFAALEPEEAREQFKLGPDRRDWKIENAQADLLNAGLNPKLLRRIGYRPFDERFVFYTGQSKGLIGQPGRPLAEAVDVSGIALVTVRRVEEGEFRHVFVYPSLPDGHSISSKETTHVFPLFVPTGNKSKPLEVARTENFSSDFRTLIDARYEHHYTPEEILGYVYAVLYAPAYREKYAEFLRVDFPRIPFPENVNHFEVLSALGWELIQAHLLREVPELGLGRYQGRGNNVVEKPRYVEAEESIYINDAQKFAAVSVEVWNFHIGGYRALETYLKYRKGRELTLDEINNVENIASVLAFTLEQMEKIDEAYRAAFANAG